MSCLYSWEASKITNLMSTALQKMKVNKYVTVLTKQSYDFVCNIILIKIIYL